SLRLSARPALAGCSRILRASTNEAPPTQHEPSIIECLAARRSHTRNAAAESGRARLGGTSRALHSVPFPDDSCRSLSFVRPPSHRRLARALLRGVLLEPRRAE